MRKTAIPNPTSGSDRDLLLGCLNRSFKSARPVCGKAAQQGQGIGLLSARIRLKPQLEGLVRLFQIARDLPIVGEVDEEPFPIADAIPQLPGLRRALGGQHRLSSSAVRQSQSRVRHGEFGIDLDRALKERYDRGIVAVDVLAFIPVLYAFRASSDGVVASASGVECFSTVARDSPSRVLSVRAIALREFSTSSLFAAWICS